MKFTIPSIGCSIWDWVEMVDASGSPAQVTLTSGSSPQMLQSDGK